MCKLQNNHQIIPLMNKFLIVFLFCIFSTNLFSKESDNYFKKGQDYYNKKNIEEAKLNFEKDIVRNTKNIKSYLYLAKIHKKKDNSLEFEKNLKTVLLLDPKNEEALYSLAKLKLKESDYTQSKKLILQSLTFCKNYCEELKKLKIELEKSIKK